MIEVVLKTRDKNLLGFEVSGHAQYDQSGKDIVCSAVSVLTINSINTLEEVLNLKNEIKYSEKENLITLDINTKSLDELKLHDTQVVLRGFELGITSILREYQEFVELYYREV
ncbi:MAG TPA: ribosomal-processing cysteine protease Prp [Tissierellaceae bacterium]